MDIPLTGTSTILSFFPDDTIETIRQQVALAMDTHPDRLFIEALVDFQEDYYSSNPKRWMELFYRISHGKQVIEVEALRVYLTQIRQGMNIEPRRVTRDEWQDVPDFLQKVFETGPVREWRIFGVPDDKSVILPTPPRDIVIDSNFRPVPVRQALFETIHQLDALEIRGTELSPDATELVKQVYFPFFQSTTPRDIESLRGPIKASHDQLEKLLKLKAPKPTSTSILRAKWYIPFISTRFTAPRTRFEQIFYGLTVSKETPVVSYFTAKQETTRHKFFVEDPKNKTPYIDIPMWKAWTNNTQPQRRLPTLLFYRGTSRTSFDRIAVTSKDVSVSTWRGKESTETTAELIHSTLSWLKTFDALMPFVDPDDLDDTRWELNDLSVIVSYAKEIKEFDMRRFPCMQNVFSYESETFRLLRSDMPFDVSPRVLQAYKLLQDNADLVTEMGVTEDEAAQLLAKVQELETDEKFNFEKAISGYPVVSFASKEVIIKFVTNLERVLGYASLLRYVLTSDRAEINDVCPRRLETVESTAGIAPTVVTVETDEFDLGDLLGEIEELAPAVEVAAPVQAKEEKVKVRTSALGTYNYFNNRAQRFDKEIFDSEYPKKCEKLKQVVVLTKEEQEGIPKQYNYSEVEDSQKLPLKDAIAICPPYWCMKDEIPLAEDQLVLKEDGKHCPVCDGMVRVTEKEDPRTHTVIKREAEQKYPGWKEPSAKTKSKNRVPCCYKKPTARSEVIAPKQQIDEYYVLTSGFIPSFRLAYLPEDLTKRLGINTDYTVNVPLNRINAGSTDTFRIGMGLPRTTLPVLLGEKRAIPNPSDVKDKVMLCSFFRTWKDMGDGKTQIDRIIDGIDRAFVSKTLGVLEETEYVSLILDCRVIRIKTEGLTVMCGFWADRLGPRTRTIVLLDHDILGRVTRRKGNSGSKFDYVVDMNKFPATVKATLQTAHTRSCMSNLPTFDDAIKELVATNKSIYQVILDPFERVQAVFVPQEVILPVLPVSMELPSGVVSRIGYADIEDEELPTSKTLGDFLNKTRNPGFKWADDMYSADGQYSEFLLTSGFRAPFRPEEGDGKATEVVSTIRKHTEEDLVYGSPNGDDVKLSDDISYEAEVFEFLLFSLSKDIQKDVNEPLYNAIANPKESLYKDLGKWLDSEAYWDSVDEPVQFVNKVRTPCGQMSEDKCKQSTLCGWRGSTCKIKIKPIVDKRRVLTRIVKTLKENSKQRALVLDERLSPFFSTVLYLEMPNELITTSV
jgi:hypothetical protein